MDNQMWRQDGDVIRFVDTRTIDGYVFVVDQIEYLAMSGELGEFFQAIGAVHERLSNRDEWTSLFLDSDEPGTFILGIRPPTALEQEYLNWEAEQRAQQPVHQSWGMGASASVSFVMGGTYQVNPAGGGLVFVPSVEHEEGVDTEPGS